VPDNQDYEDLRQLLARPEHWTEEEAQLAETLRRSQLDAMASCHPKDIRRIQLMSAVVGDLDRGPGRVEGNAVNVAARTADAQPIGAIAHSAVDRCIARWARTALIGVRSASPQTVQM